MNAKKTNDTTTKSSIQAAIEGGEEMAKIEAAKTDQTEQQGGSSVPDENPDAPTEEAPAPSAWGGFAIEVGVAPPARGGDSKYDWASFPVSATPENSATWPSVFIPKIGAKTISKSIKAYRERLQKEDATAKLPEFTISVVKDKATKEPTGVRVFRKS